MNNFDNEKLDEHVQTRQTESTKSSKQYEDVNRFIKATCPFCHLNTTIILDYKKIECKESDWICLVCGHIFRT